MQMAGRGPALVGLALTLLLGGFWAVAQEASHVGPAVIADTGLLPKGSRLDGLTMRQPRQLLSIEQRGQEQNYLVALGNMAFSAPDLMGGVARQAGISCATCHSSGEINRDFFIPGLSAHPGSVDVSHRLFNPRTADGIANPLDIPSLRGLTFTAPFGRDGRFGSLREFTRNVIVGEFAGAEPPPLILDALVAYQLQFDFLPNDQITADGRLTSTASAEAQRGAELFRAPMAGMDGRSCASCHLPSSHFTDGQQHDIGTGGAFVTPTLLNANDTAPFFHDGGAADYAAVLEHFDATFDLGLDSDATRDLVAYLEVVGHGEAPFEPQDFAFDRREIEIFARTLATSIADRDQATVALTVATISRELREVRERWPAMADRPIRGVVANWVLAMRRVGLAAETGDWSAAAARLADWRELVAEQAPLVAAAEPRSLYRPEARAAYLAEFTRLEEMAARHPE